MARSENAQRAVDLYKALQEKHQWTASTAWCGIVRLLLSCEVYRSAWGRFGDVVAYVDSNRFRPGKRGTPATLTRAEHLTSYLADQLRVDRKNLCNSVGIFWRGPQIRSLQPNNPAGHAFRSLVANALEMFGDPRIRYEEAGDPRAGCVGQDPCSELTCRATHIFARREHRVVAIVAAYWRLRHSGLGFLRKTVELATKVRKYNPRAQVYVVVGEFDTGRLRRLLANCRPIIPDAAISAAVHFAPQLIHEGLAQNGGLVHLRSLEWLIGETLNWWA